MSVKNLRGFKYPDIELTRWFFKEKLDEKCGKVLEFGSNNGNNLSLFAGYDYECIGVDLDEKNTQNANFNFKNVYKFESKFSFFAENMLDFAKNHKDINADILIIPNVINYILKSDFIEFLQNIRKNRLFKSENLEKVDFFLRARSVKDHRYGLGKSLGDNAFLLSLDEFSGEKNLLCQTYFDYELVEILKTHLNLSDFTLITSENLNVKDKVFIKDSDIIIYGKIS